MPFQPHHIKKEHGRNVVKYFFFDVDEIAVGSKWINNSTGGITEVTFADTESGDISFKDGDKENTWSSFKFQCLYSFIVN